MTLRIGIDFDNTIVNYDGLFSKVAKKLKLNLDNYPTKKESIKKEIFKKKNGLKIWQRLQGKVYGEFIANAKIFDGLRKFIIHSNLKNHKIFIVSHKTHLGHYDEKKISLRKAAIDFLNSKKIINSSITGIKKKNIFFYTTRGKKITQIKKLNLNFFIDDLSEVLCDKNFPTKTKKILFSKTNDNNENIIKINNWFKIDEIINGYWSIKHLKKLSSTLLKDKVILNLNQIHDGINSKVYKLKLKKNKNLILKIYPFEDNFVSRRMKVENNSLRYLKKNNFSVPGIYKSFFEFNCSFYEFQSGKKNLKATELLIDQCYDFLKKLFLLSRKTKINLFQNAKEACFNPNEICEQIERKFINLLKIKNKALNNFLLLEFRNLFTKYSKITESKLNKEFKSKISNSNRILSPSDFGLHNTLSEKNKLHFIDFEYFGWDDPIKLICDFVWHPG
ncbi:hypothetical protein N9349_05380, partial [Candidatus Pelagibacter sp.]|nr:hypothetical protein [Candidatus Pelagibacter sp.]